MRNPAARAESQCAAIRFPMVCRPQAPALIDTTVTLPYFNWEEIRGLSIGGTAKPVTDPNEINRVSELMLRKFPQILRYALAGEKGLFLVRVTPEVVSLLDYRKGFGHIDLVKL